MADVDVPWIVRQMIGRDAPVRADAAPCCASGGDVLAVTDLVLPRERGGFTVDHVSLTLGAGEIVGIYGLLGAGRTELLESIMGCRRDATGSIRIAGAEISDRDVSDRMAAGVRSEEHTSELQSLMRTSYAVFCLKKKNNENIN